MSAEIANTKNGQSLPPSSNLRELEGLLAHPALDVAQALDHLLGAVADGSHPTELWQRFHEEVVSQRRETDLEGLYTKLALNKRWKHFRSDQQAYVFLRVQNYYELVRVPERLLEFTEKAFDLGADVSEALLGLDSLPEGDTSRALRAKILVQAASRSSSVEQHLDLLEQAAGLAEMTPNGPPIAVDAYQKMLQLDERLVGAREHLVTHLINAGKAREASRVLEQGLELHPALDSADVRRLRERVVDLYVGQVREPGRALHHIEALLADDPAHERARAVAASLLDLPSTAPRAAAALSDAFEKTGDFVKAAESLARELQMVRGARRLDVQRRLAILRQDVLGDAPGALKLLGPAVAAEPGDDDLRRRFRVLSQELGQAGEGIRTLARVARASSEPGVEARIGIDLGLLYLGQGDVPRAEAQFEQVVARVRDKNATLVAARQLAELHENAGRRAQWMEMLGVILEHEEQIEAKQAAARKLTELTARALEAPASQANARPEQERRERERGLAIAAWKVLVDSESADEALRNLETLYRLRPPGSDLLEVLAARARRVENRDEARALAIEIAELQSRPECDPSAALAAWQQVIEQFGPAREIYLALIPKLEQKGDPAELAHTLEASVECFAEQERALLWNRIAELKHHQLGDASGALVALTRALELAPCDQRLHRAALALFASGPERLAVARLLEPMLRSSGKQPELVLVLETQGALGTSAEERLAAYREAHTLATELEPANTERLLELVERALEIALDHPPQTLEWLRHFERLTESEAAQARAERLLRLVGSRALNSAPLAEVARVASDALCAADLPERALAVLRAAVKYAEPGSDLYQRFDSLLARHGTPEERVETYRQALAHEMDPSRRRTLLRSLATLEHEALGNLEAAVRAWRDLLEELPEDFTAHRALLLLYSELNQSDDAERELERALAFANPSERTELLHEVARLKLLLPWQNPERALELLTRTLEADPSSEAALALASAALEHPETRRQAARLLDSAAQAQPNADARARVIQTLLAASTSYADLAEDRPTWIKTLLETKSDTPEEGFEIALTGAEQAASDVALWVEAERFARELETPRPVVDAYRRALRRATDPAVISLLGQRLVEFFEEWLEDELEVAAILDEVVARCPTASWAFERLKVTHSASQRWAELFLLYDREIARAQEPERARELLREAAMTARDFAQNPAQAIVYLERLVEQSPLDVRSEVSLERLYERLGRTRPLIALLTRRARSRSGPERAGLDARIAELWIGEDRPEAALELVEGLLAQEPSRAGAVALLERLLAMPSARTTAARAGDLDTERPAADAAPLTVHERSVQVLKDHYRKIGSLLDVARLLAIEVETATASSERLARLQELIELQLEKLADTSGAFERTLDLVELAPTVAAHRQKLAELAELTGAFDRQAALLLRVGQSLGDDTRGLELIFEAASVHETKRLDTDRATLLFSQVLMHSGAPTTLAISAAHRLDVLLEARGEHTARADALERLASLEEPTAAGAAWKAAARVAEQALMDDERAVRAYSACLVVDPEDREALDGLIHALARAGRTDELIQTLERRAALTELLSVRRGDWVRIANLHRHVRQDRGAAIEAWRRIRTAYGRDVESFEALSELLAAERRASDLVLLVEEELAGEADAPRRATLMRELGILRRDQTGDPLGALEAFADAHAWEEAVDVVMLTAVVPELRLEACRRLLARAVESWQSEGASPESRAGRAAAWAEDELTARLLETDDVAEAVECLLAASTLPFDVRRQRESKRRAALYCAERLLQAARATELYRELFREDPQDAVAEASVTAFATLLEAEGSHEAVAGLWEQQARFELERGRVDRAGDYFERAAHVRDERLGETSKAVDDYREASALGTASAMRALAAVYARLGRHRAQAEVLEWLCASTEAGADRAGGDSSDVLALADAYVAAGEAHTARARLEARCRTTREKALKERLAELYRSAEMWRELQTALAEIAQATTELVAQRALLVEAAELALGRGEDPELAASLLERAVALAPHEARLRLKLAEAQRRSGRLAAAEKTLGAQLEQYGPRRPRERALVHGDLAEVLVEAGRPDEAIAELETATKIDPTHQGLLERLAQLAQSAGDLTKAERNFGALLLLAPSRADDGAPTRAATFLALSEIAQARGESARAAEFLESAFEATLEHPNEGRALERLLARAGQISLLARALELGHRHAATAEDKAFALARWVDVYGNASGDLSSEQSALLAHGESALTALSLERSKNDAAWAALGEVFEALGDPSAALTVLEQRVGVWRESSQTPPRAEPFYRLAEHRLLQGENIEEVLDLLERAVARELDAPRVRALLDRILREHPASERGFRLLERVCRASSDRIGLVRTLAALVLLPGPRGAEFCEARNLARESEDVLLTQEVLESALHKSSLELEPAILLESRLELGKLYRAAGKWREALTLEEQTAPQLPPAEARSLLLDVAERASTRLGDAAWSRRLYEQLRAENPADRSAWEPLLSLYKQAGKAEKLAWLLEETARVAEAAKDVARLELEHAELLLGDAAHIETAKAMLRRALGRDPSQTKVALQLAELLEKHGDYAELRELLEERLGLALSRGDRLEIVHATLRLGALLERQGEYELALEYYRRAQLHDSRNIEVLTTILRLAKVLGNTALVADAMEGLLLVDPTKCAADTTLRLVKLRDRMKDPEGALRALAVAAEGDPSDERLSTLYATRLLENGQAAAARAFLRAACGKVPLDTRLLEQMLRAHTTPEDRALALELVDRLAVRNSSSELRRARTALLVELGRGEEALADLEQTYRTSGEGAEGLRDALERTYARAAVADRSALGSRLLELLFDMGDAERAAHYAGQLLERHPADKELLTRIAELALRAQDQKTRENALALRSALEHGAELASTAVALYELNETSSGERVRAILERAERENPGLQSVTKALTALYAHMGKQQELAELLIGSAEREFDPGRRHALLLQAGKSLLESDRGKAVQIFEHARELIPDHIEGGLVLARCYVAEEQTEEALALLTSVTEAHHGRRLRELGLVYQEICSIQLEDGYLTDAVIALGHACEMEPKNSLLAMRRGQLAREIGEREIAVSAFRSVTIMKRAEREGDEGATLAIKAEAHFQLAELALEEGDPRKAKILVSKALTEDPGHRAAKTLLEQLRGGTGHPEPLG